MVILMAWVIFTEPVDVFADAEVMLSWEITPEVRAISIAKTDVDFDVDANADATAEQYIVLHKVSLNLHSVMHVTIFYGN